MYALGEDFEHSINNKHEMDDRNLILMILKDLIMKMNIIQSLFMGFKTRKLDTFPKIGFYVHFGPFQFSDVQLG